MYKILFLVFFTVFIFNCSSIPKTEKYANKSTVTQQVNPKEIVFIHGMFMTPVSWHAWQKYFETRGYKTSAPAWPHHEENQEQLAKLTLDDVVNHYREILKTKKVKPIVIGHSMGGLVAQILLSEGLASAAVAIDSAPPKGVFVISGSFLKSNWDVLKPWAGLDKPLVLSQNDFSYAFCNAQSEAEQKRLYTEFAVPESKRVGRGPLNKIAKIDFEKSRGPLLVVAGEKDHIIPAKLNYKNFEAYEDTPAYTEFLLAEGRDHSLVLSTGWEMIAESSRVWLETIFQNKY